MSADEEDYGEFADEDFIEALSQASQSLPPHPPSRRTSGDGPDSGDEDGNSKSKKKKYKIHEGVDEVPTAIILGATQAEGLNPDSSPYRIRGPIYRKPRPESPKPPLAPLSTAAARPAPTNAPQFKRTPPRRISGLSHDDSIAQELKDLPSDAFSSPSPPPQSFSSLPRQRLVAAQTELRQTTLFGGRAPDEVPASQVNKRHNFVQDLPPELPTQHALDHEAMKTWVYPTNLGGIRDYQFSIVRNGLFNNLLVALPTGLGKTFIAATIMYNYYRWTKDAQIIFVAPTKPLVAQQVDACFKIVGIPRSDTTMLTGEQQTGLRAEEWLEKRVFFMTPQTLINDLSTGIADPKKIVLLVVDEAHRATGNYAYVKVVQFLRRFNKSFRVLALTATPGGTVEAVQDVIDHLEISQVEIRTEESIDIQQFVHKRTIDKVLLDPSDEIIMVKELLSKALQPLVNLLCSQNAYYNKDPMSLNPFQLMKARQAWFASPTGKQANQGLKGMMMGLFSVLASIAHSIKLLNFHGISPFYSAVKDFRQSVEEGNKGGKYRKQILESPDFRKMMERIQFWLNKDDFVGHPKLTYLCDTILNHFLDAGEGRLADGAPPSSTRVIVFSEFRDSAEDIARILNKHEPMIRASVFVGQADSKRSQGMNQAKQQETIRKFQSGIYNVLVATSIGEEGLDIGQVDLIVCYDASGSPIRMLQRMGRTGRKRAGNIVLLLMRGKEEEAFSKAKDNYEQMQKMISSGERFSLRHDLSVRIIPRDVKPTVDKRIIEIPIENTQDQSLPEPKRRPKPRKKPPKKFHMPDGVEIGFQMASRIKEEKGDCTSNSGITVMRETGRIPEDTELAPIPSLESVFLCSSDTDELKQRYQNVPGLDIQEVEMPSMASQTVAQRSLLPIAKVAHGQFTKKAVHLFQTLAISQRREDRFLKPFGDIAPAKSWSVPHLVGDDDGAIKQLASMRRPKPSSKSFHGLSDVDSDSEGDLSAPNPPPQTTALNMSFSEDASSERNVRGPLKRKRKRRRTNLRSSEGDGDDLENSEAPSEDSDDGESLKSFLAEDGEEIATMTLSSSQTMSSPIAQRTLKPLYKPSPLMTTQDTEDDDMPDLGDMIGMKTKPAPLELKESDSEDNPVFGNHGNRGKRRRVVVDDSDDE
ncbi:ATP-dependent DNA helicase MPH1 [Hyphodiscus hymeniophilus]|uniref:ATP-dependent DNA helicase n=1 Tax=Hyphodiscus hymeniophilus TaxID=353542 RepID=A0A9P6VN33_9HELO|nr:ATP-dependent DNA helicase MPH1 [Hyphodiscus hymeniophilus]